jgi:hypothetical protein
MLWRKKQKAVVGWEGLRRDLPKEGTASKSKKNQPWGNVSEALSRQGNPQVQRPWGGNTPSRFKKQQ